MPLPSGFGAALIGESDVPLAAPHETRTPLPPVARCPARACDHIAGMTDGVAPKAGMTISIRARRDVVIMDLDRFLGAARRALRDIVRVAPGPEAATAVAMSTTPYKHCSTETGH